MTVLSWFHLTLETDTPIVDDLKADATSPADRLARIGQRVGMAPAPRSRELFDLAEPMSSAAAGHRARAVRRRRRPQTLFSDTGTALAVEMRDDHQHVAVGDRRAASRPAFRHRRGRAGRRALRSAVPEVPVWPAAPRLAQRSPWSVGAPSPNGQRSPAATSCSASWMSSSSGVFGVAVRPHRRGATRRLPSRRRARRARRVRRARGSSVSSRSATCAVTGATSKPGPVVRCRRRTRSSSRTRM